MIRIPVPLPPLSPRRGAQCVLCGGPQGVATASFLSQGQVLCLRCIGVYVRVHVCVYGECTVQRLRRCT